MVHKGYRAMSSSFDQQDNHESIFHINSSVNFAPTESLRNPPAPSPFAFWRIRLPLVWGLWVLVLAWGELGAGRFSACNWPDQGNAGYHLAVVADPQLTDFYSYDMAKGSWILSWTEYFSDVYMRRHFQLLARKGNVHGVLVLGDLFDGGRILTPEEHAIHKRRFDWIFGGHHPQIQFWNMRYTHMIRLGLDPSFLVATTMWGSADGTTIAPTRSTEMHLA
ncbi:Aste57867_5104 [Aphanomyces stellatus]|uniref:Aste57867_5104 protein n=1 Tax=Aphanomyces stellatus TaxID=120398 RepID=A0A485KCZ3_9STRA|nr:hypothetical protein As57867_005091 [Aphanomyces stellatus]VFT82184.1 Aste57867_5104 [Aphanomyces stellatus]